MEKSRHLVLHKLFWFAAVVQFAMFTSALNTTTVSPPPEIQSQPEPTIGVYAWSSWGNWSPCSKSCGGGVAVQERQCLPRTRSITLANSTLPPPIVTVRVTRQTHAGECAGVARRYHQCNTAPCPGGETDMRAEQCAVYDRRPFRGRFYTWMPYIDGDSPCTLNCRPLGQQFYASLALVADGTPCTKPGFRAICVQGECKIVGRETVLAVASNRELRCGRRLVSGLFSRPRLPLGYSYVTTVPRGACRLNISEIVPSDNYIALKISNSSYIMNGEFAVSAPGTYEAAGARFIYSRVAGLDNVFALGPIHHPVDIMVLYTQPNPSIRYEYFTESTEGDIEPVTRPNIPEMQSSIATKHIRRHHNFEPYPRSINLPRYPDIVSMSKEVGAEDEIEENVVGTRKFMWKITSYTQCTRSCGGGIQLGKYRCVEITTGSDKEVSQVHCSGSPPVGRRRRCNNVPCPPRWRAAAWTTCPECGPATRTRIVGCVQDHFRGITKINDQKCPGPKPTTTEPCDIPNCDGTPAILKGPRVIAPREHTDNFRDGPVYTVSVNSSDLDVGPEYTFSTTAGWLYTEWSDCIGWCVGSGVQTRGVRCADPSGCTPKKAPESSRSCTPKLTCEPHDGKWFTGEWSRCTSPCNGKQVRGVLCIGGSGRHLRDAACKDPRPEQERDCEEECPPNWFFSDWEQCNGNCSTGVGVQRRSVVCMRDESFADEDCQGVKPQSQRNCDPQCTVTDDFPPDLPIESQKVPVFTTTKPPSTTIATTTKNVHQGCEDKLNNCALAVQARLCHYNYYVQNCCDSCFGK